MVDPIEVRLASRVAAQGDLERVFAMIPSFTGENGTGNVMGGVGLGAGLGVGLGVGLKTLGSVPFAVLFPIGTVVGSYLIARFAFTLFSKMRKSRIKDIAENIVTLVESTGESSQSKKED